jgi:hypothetical protein
MKKRKKPREKKKLSSKRRTLNQSENKEALRNNIIEKKIA